MLSYEVTLDIDPALVTAVEEYMLNKHIPELWATDCFVHIRCARAQVNRIRTSYFLRDEADLERYMKDFAPRLRDDFAAHFPAGVQPARETWQDIACWGDAAQ